MSSNGLRSRHGYMKGLKDKNLIKRVIIESNVANVN